MKIIKPTPSQAAYVLQRFLKENHVTWKLSQTQEAVARMLGFKDWSALTSAMDPRVGTPVGCLQQESEGHYTLMGGSQTTVMIAVNNLQVSVKHDDEGVVVDVFSKKGLKDGDNSVESIGSTWVMFSEADGDEDDENDDEDDEVEHRNKQPEDLLKSLLKAVWVEYNSSDGVVPFFICKEAIKSELREYGSMDPSRQIVVFYHNDKERV